MSFFTTDDLDQIRRGPLAPPTPPQAPFGTQLARGLVSGLTLGGFRPFKEAGPGGIPETVGSLVGGGVSFVPLFRAGGLAAAGLGRVAPRLLAEGVSAGQAARRIASPTDAYLRFRPVTETLSSGLTGGQALAAGLAVGGPSLLGEAIEEEPRTVGERLRSALLGGGLAALGQGWLSRRFRPPPLQTAAGAAPKAAEVVGRTAEDVEALYPGPFRSPTTVEDVLHRGPFRSPQGDVLEPDFAKYATAKHPLREAAGGGEVIPSESLFGRQPAGVEQLRQPRSVLPGYNVYIGSGQGEAFIPKVGRILQVPKLDLDPTKLEMGALFIRNGLATKLPVIEDVAARVAQDIPFPSLRQPGTCPPGSVMDQACANYVFKSPELGFSRNAVTKFLGKHGLLPVSAVLRGIPQVENLPYILSKGDGVFEHMRRGLLDRLEPVSLWSPRTKQTVQRLFFQHAKDAPEVLDAAVVREAPEAMSGMRSLREVMEEIRQRYVADDVLRPDQQFPNYFPVIREVLEITSPGIMKIEKGRGYVPRHLENIVSPRDPQFAKRRHLFESEDFPRKVSFDETLSIYLTQFARHQTTRQLMPEIQEAVANTPAEYKRYVADVTNFWLGHPEAVTRVSDMNHVLRQYQFIRAIGGSLLSPIVNTFQRLNTLAVVSPSSFMQAFRDVRDPAMLQLLERAKIPNTTPLAKLDVDLETLQASGTLRGMAQVLARESGRMFAWSEKGNRVHAFFAGLREAQKRGVQSLDEQMEFARKIVDDTQFIYSGANIPPIFRKSGAGRIIGQFQTFRINQADFMLRLADEFVQGAKTGELARMTPFLKFAGGSAFLGGVTSMLPGDWAEEKAMRATFGKAFGTTDKERLARGGVPELLFGVTLANQMGLGSIGADDLQSFLFMLPGPSVGFVQALVSAAAGKQYLGGRGLSGLGEARELSFDERARALIQVLPAGIQLNRLAQALRLYQSSGEFKESMDWGQVLGVKPATGDLLSSVTTNLGQTLAVAMGIQPAGRVLERQILGRQSEMKQEMATAFEQASSLAADGRWKEAAQKIQKFNESYQEELQGVPVSLSPRSMRAAMIRRLLPPGQRMRPPIQLRGAEPFTALEEVE